MSNNNSYFEEKYWGDIQKMCDENNARYREVSTLKEKLNYKLHKMMNKGDAIIGGPPGYGILVQLYGKSYVDEYFKSLEDERSYEELKEAYNKAREKFEKEELQRKLTM